MAETARLLVFLDFDGVLRRSDAPLHRLEEPLLVAFEAAVRRIPDAQIVITSSWRETVDLPALRRLFSPDVAERIVGVAPFGNEGRYGEIVSYLKEAGAVEGRWVVVDDDPYGYPGNTPLILVDPAKGFGPEDAQKLVDMGGG
jgi:HAD domain in Swiss Army Knife RNA repair proteins